MTYLLFMGVGILRSSALWDVNEEGGWEEYVKDWGDKAIGIIGNSLVKSIVNYTLSKTWIGEPFSLCTMLELAEKDREAFRDEKYYKEFRHEIEADLNSVAQTTIRGSNLQKLVGELFKGEMKRRFAARPELIEKTLKWIDRVPCPCSLSVIPQFTVCCRRLTPGPGHLEALCTENLEDGSAEHIDVLVCATGFDVSYCFPFTVLGRDGLALNAHWAATGGAEAYLSIAMDDFPNLFVGGGPNLAVNSGSVTCYI
ncbi:hypothetical protein B0F90DRAFT_1672703 [Multifurca ochricompacta]|uniref:Flavin-containing monooxygenase n=1 Tax=Multifurca ochricompacta TaxID=376703 RepID=A0AAD4QIJ9_9AGAM|nr:hypothetical protein B0F90DRAFT_1672703 [Multifurca ochricompacta]